MRSLKKLIMCIMVVLIILTVYPSITAQAYVTGGYTLNGGVGNYGYTRRYYYVSDSIPGDVAEYIAESWSDWVNTTDDPGVTTSISVNQTTYQPDSSFDYYMQDEFENNTVAVTYFFSYSDYVSTPGYMPTDSNWGWTQIILDTENFSNAYNYNGINVKKSVVAHEAGHAMGLWHSSPSSNLMYPYCNVVTTDRCTVDELNGINSLYN